MTSRACAGSDCALWNKPLHMLIDSRSRLSIPSRRSPMKVSKLSEVPRQSMSRATKFFHGAEHVSRQGLTDESKEVSVITRISAHNRSRTSQSRCGCSGCYQGHSRQHLHLLVRDVMQTAEA